jgi:ribosomal protein S18 acetylase RimI-like enzyme
MSATVRRATVEDALTIHAMITALAATSGQEGKVASTVDTIVRFGFGSAPRFEVLLAEVAKRVVGMSLFFPSFSTWRGTPGAYIQDFYVAPDVRGTGVAAQLLAATAAYVSAGGGTYLRLSVAASNAAAQRFYRRNGMAWAGDERIYFIDGDAFANVAGYGAWRG